ncbi:MAG: hypothetical protein K0R17_3960 [Rariglobus sp.]|jgi:hypothetical protein|nr:hypothetical protein [Rariglobus sp.]
MHDPRPSTQKRSGFALLITITLLAFLVLLLVSLAALTRVETQVASNNQQLSQARQNALMGLNIALGQLQLTLGPDRRVSAPASQKDADGTPNYGAADFSNNSHWTGVYRQNPSVSTRDPQLLNWLVSGNQGLTVSAAGANTPAVVPNAIVTGLSAGMTATTPATVGGKPAVLLVGPGSVMAESAAAASADILQRFVVAPLEEIKVQAGVVAGSDPASGNQTVGHFAYWVGDEGTKAKVSLIDPWENPSPATLTATAASSAQTRDYRFINSQRSGIEGVDQAGANTPLSTNYPANAAALLRVLDLSQLPLTNTAGQAALTLAAKNRFHDLTTTSYGLLADVANGGLKKDLTAWVSETTTNPNPSTPANGNDDYIHAGDPSDSSKYGLPKWELIRDYARTFAMTGAVTPRRQTATQQGIFPVITSARMSYNLTCSAPNTPPDFHIMPVVTLWNPYNVKIAAKTYEFCVQYSNIAPQIPGNPGNKLSFRTGAYAPLSPTNLAVAPEDFDLTLIRVVHGGNFNGNTFIQPGSQEYGETTSTTEAEYFRFRLEVSKDMEPGESRIFTICDAEDSSSGYDGTLYKSGVSQMSDRGALRNDVAVNNSVRMRGQVPFNSFIVANTQRIYLYPNKATAPDTRMFFARMEMMLTEPLPASIAGSNTNAVREFLRANAYQRIVGVGFYWRPTMESIQVPAFNTGVDPLLYHRIELMMSDLPTSFPESNPQENSVPATNPHPGAPRWLASLNPQASTFLRKPFVEGAARSNFNPSYLVEYYTKPPTASFTFNLTKHDIPNADADGRVSAGTRVSNTSGGAQNLVIRELQSSGAPLFSIGQLQHANTSLLNLNPAYAIGNSHANLYVNRNASYTVVTATDSFADDDAVTASSPAVFPGAPLTGFPGNATFNRIYDLSYLLNQTLWDGYFFSTVPHELPEIGQSALTTAQAGNPNYRLPNARHQFYWRSGAASDAEVTELKATRTAAAHLLVNGGFNVNSTSVQAWRALLYSHNNVATDPADTATIKHPFSRFATALSSPVNGSTPNDTWMGYRILSDAQIDALAPRIVAEIRTRGPFLSLSDFVNRRLVADNTGLKGALQAAIDAGTINEASSTHALPAMYYPRDIKDPSNLVAPDVEQQIVYSGAANSANTAADTTQIAASRVSGAPGYLTQADLLTALGPSLTARSDTFRIRSYGDVQNAATGAVEARAWCEAMVQRMPEYVNAGDTPDAAPANLSSLDNKTFGRRFKIISFRWLSTNDI